MAMDWVDLREKLIEAIGHLFDNAEELISPRWLI